MKISQLRSMLDKREISAWELTQSYIEKIRNKNHILNCYITVCEEKALEDSRKAQMLIDSNSALPLTGIPLSVKDNICTLGIKTTCASKMLADFVPPYNATVVERLENTGAVILGKTNMDEFAMGSTNETSYFGSVKNPYNTDYTSGGSSGGAAAGVSADLCAGAIGSDTGGSVRQPSAFCGVTGLKPTYGTLSRWGLIAFASSLDQIGTIAKSAEDCGLILSAIAGYDENDATTAQLTDTAYTSKIGMSVKGLKIGIPTEFFKTGISDEVCTAVMSAAKYYEDMGAELVTVSMPSLEFAVSAYYLISSAEASSNLARYDGIRFGYRSEKGGTYDELVKNTRSEAFGDEVKRRILLGNYALSSGYYEDYYKKALKIRSRIKSEYSAIFEKCDVILTPTAPTVAYRLGEAQSSLSELYSADICTVSASIAGLPAISTTCGYDKNGLPVGMSLTGKAFDEATIIAVCDAFERDFKRQEAVL